MKKGVLWLGSLILMIGLFLTGCSSKKSSGEATKKVQTDKLVIYTTVFPLTDFAQKIGGKYVEVQSIYPANVDAHSFEPTAKDMIKLAEADLLIYNGAGFESFAEKATEVLHKQKVMTLNASKNVKLIERATGAETHSHEEDVHSDDAEASSDAHSHDAKTSSHEHDALLHDAEASSENINSAQSIEESSEHEKKAEDLALSHETERSSAENPAGEDEALTEQNGKSLEKSQAHAHGKYDPHVWLSPYHSIKMAANIKDAFIELLPEHEEIFEKNYKKLKAELTILDQDFKSEIQSAKNKHILVSHRAYGYWEHHYGIVQIAVTGLSPTEEPSQKQLTELIKEAKAHNIKYIAFEQNVSPRVAKIIQKEIGAKTVILHNLESVTNEEMKNNESYISLMRDNLKTLKKILN